MFVTFVTSVTFGVHMCLPPAPSDLTQTAWIPDGCRRTDPSVHVQLALTATERPGDGELRQAQRAAVAGRERGIPSSPQFAL
jgi:hypothetical protein